MKKYLYLIFGFSLIFSSCCEDYNAGYEKGKNIGYSEGYSEGKNDGVELGIDRGRELERVGIRRTSTIVSGFVLFLIHVFMIFSIVGMIVFLSKAIIDGTDNYERMYRVAAIMLAMLIFFVSATLNKSISEVIITSIEISKDGIKSILGKLSLVGVFGAITAAIAHKVIRSNAEILERVIIIFSTILVLIFADLYVRGFKNPDNLLVNSSFVIGVFIYMIFFTRKPTI